MFYEILCVLAQGERDWNSLLGFLLGEKANSRHFSVAILPRLRSHLQDQPCSPPGESSFGRHRDMPSPRRLARAACDGIHVGRAPRIGKEVSGKSRAGGRRGG
jgi:hypothetical protein